MAGLINYITACSFSGTVIAPSGDVGGVAGNAMYSGITACRSSGSVEGGGSNASVGGVVGAVKLNGVGILTACYSSSVVTSTANSTGGVIGYGRAVACYSSGRVVVTGGTLKGGVIGDNGGIWSCYWYNPYYSSPLLAPSGYPQFGTGSGTNVNAAPFGSGGPADIPGWPADNAALNWGVYVSGPDPEPYTTGSTNNPNKGKFWKILPGYNTRGDYPKLYWE